MSVLHLLGPNPGAVKKGERKGRGIGTGNGKTAGRGTKGQRARNKVRAQFEGGQTPLHRRLPRKKGFRNPNHVEYSVLNVGDLENWFESGAEVNIETLMACGAIGTLKNGGVKILGDGELTVPLTVKVHACSKSAIEKIQAAGGTVEAI